MAVSNGLPLRRVRWSSRVSRVVPGCRDASVPTFQSSLIQGVEIGLKTVCGKTPGTWFGDRKKYILLIYITFYLKGRSKTLGMILERWNENLKTRSNVPKF